eukprot:CAMPEP_0204518076 /NCGR_PEP_ID=MMETSP0661-20131031/4013_1 /ASSEMBLY_ACC=CAM_ASM_000606 /TAXON_ID=109239 /ORGANISM="Alexandrium margalefi, Strain AMGDE01CS-322" /LENGTH=269 /DNA_ID=CAMNT_0051523511 /DNA_START=67 /DNA_END=876 /DNA_ORIENTATION=-
MAHRMPLGSAALQAALLPWMEPPSEGVREERTAAVREEAQLILEILEHVEAVASHEEICRAFSRTPCELHLAEAVLTGGAAGELNRPRMLSALRAAAAAGSTWAPLWLGDMDAPRLDSVSGEEVQGKLEGLDARRRGWYIQAAERGHPDAPRRLAARGVGHAAAAERVALPAAPAVGLASAFAAGGGLQISGFTDAEVATDGTAEGEEEEEEEAEADEVAVGMDQVGLISDELCRRLEEVAEAVDAATDDVGEAGSLSMVSLGPLHSRL